MTTSGHEDDELVLAGGGMIRGRITEIIPDQSVAIMPTGRDELREVAWSEIDEIRRAGGKPAPAEANPTEDEDEDEVQPGVLGGLPHEPEPYQGPYVRIDVPNGRNLSLYEVLAEGSGRVAFTMYRVDVSVERPICSSPCNRRVDLNRSASHVIRGDRVAPSKPFHLPSGDRLTLHVQPRSKALRPGGWAVFTIGLISTITGTPMSIIANQDTGEPETSFDRKYKAAGGATLGIGIAMLVGGVVMMAMGRTKVRVD